MAEKSVEQGEFVESDLQTSTEFEILSDSSISEENIVSLAALLSVSYREFTECVSRVYMEDLVNVGSRIGLGKEQIVMRDCRKQIIGCASLYSQLPDQHAKNFPKNSAYVRFLAIHPNFRGQGLGTSLMRFCFIRAKLHGNEFLVR